MNKIKIFGLGLLMMFCFSITSFAGWKADSFGWRYQEYPGGPYLKGGWKWIDADHIGVAKCYYFRDNGYILASTTTPDGYVLDPTGAWTVNGIVQTRTVPSVTYSPSPAPSAPYSFSTPQAVEESYDRSELRKWVISSDGVAKDKRYIKAIDGTTWSGQIMSFNEDGAFAQIKNPGYVGFTGTVTLQYRNDPATLNQYSLVVYGDKGDRIASYQGFNNSISEKINVDLLGNRQFTIRLEAASTPGATLRQVYLVNPTFY